MSQGFFAKNNQQQQVIVKQYFDDTKMQSTLNKFAKATFINGKIQRSC